MLDIQNLQSGYGAVPVIHDVSFSIEKGETLVILGRNGVGKTTLLKSIIGSINATAGSVHLNGENIVNWRPYQRARAGVSYVPQGKGIFPRLTVEENLLIGLRSREDRAKNIPENIIEMFPILKPLMKQKGGTLSGGQQQILALARALCGAPDLLLLDEPSEGIQPSIVQEIGEYLNEFNSTMGLTILLVEQNLELARAVAFRCLVMEKGRISVQLSKEQLNDEDLVFQSLAM